MRVAQEKQFTTHDGSALFYRYWPPAIEGGSTRAVVLFHRGHEHSARIQHVVDELALGNFAMFAWDARGHGHSPGARGDSPSFGALVKDVDSFMRHLCDVYEITSANIAVIGQSVGAVLVATWAHDYAPQVRCLVLTSPAFKVRLYVPWARQGLALIQRLFGNFFITSYVKAKLLTHDPDRIRSYEEDPLVTKAISARVLLGLYDAADRIIADAQAIRLPLQLLISGKDWVVHQEPQNAFFERLGSTIKERHLLPGFLHDTLGERDRKLAIDKIRGFIEQMFSTPAPVDSLRQAHCSGYTRDEETRLGKPLPLLSLRNLNFALTRLSMRTLGRLSQGISTGLTTGFDSGSSLDYVYLNKSHGAFLVGKLIDRAYLNAIGWRGIRERRLNLVRAIVEAAQQLHVAGQALRLADVAAGHGRYILDAVEKLPERPQSILLRDFSDLNIHHGRALIAEKRFEDIARFELGDAFDESALQALTPRPNVVVVSGLYELFSNNDLVMRSLRGLASAVDFGGYLVYTGQPWHPQIEMIARTLTSHRDHQAWVMRRRTQAELDELVSTAGFSKIDQWIDDWGIFTVSLARRV